MRRAFGSHGFWTECVVRASVWCVPCFRGLDEDILAEIWCATRVQPREIRPINTPPAPPGPRSFLLVPMSYEKGHVIFQPGAGAGPPARS